jgi:hypothetical protein
MPVPIVSAVAAGELLVLVRDAQHVEMGVEAAVSVEGVECAVSCSAGVMVLGDAAGGRS